MALKSRSNEMRLVVQGGVQGELNQWSIDNSIILTGGKKGIVLIRLFLDLSLEHRWLVYKHNRLPCLSPDLASCLTYL